MTIKTGDSLIATIDQQLSMWFYYSPVCLDYYQQFR